MKLAIATMLLMLPPLTSAQTLDKLHVQAHGYVTQGFVYSTANNWDTTGSSKGSAGWTDAVLSVSTRPTPKLTVGAQARYFLLGDLSNRVLLDWAQVDLKFNNYFGVRAGKVKSPTGLLNEEQDIDPAYIWVLLPESIYPVASRDSSLAHYGGVVYGRAVLGERLGKLQYRGFGGERVIGRDDGTFDGLRDAGILLPNGLKGLVFGGTLRWETPLRGMMLGAGEDTEKTSGPVNVWPLFGQFQGRTFYRPFLFTRFERNKMSIAGEYSRFNVDSKVALNKLPSMDARMDTRAFYIMATYGLTKKLTSGLYYSAVTDRQMPLSAGRYQKDWAICGRYDFSSFVYAKLEQHVIDGTLIGYTLADNPNGLQPNARMTLLKIGVNF